MRLIVDIGGEGRHRRAWNVNPSPIKTLGPERGQPIPRHIAGRADSIPLASGAADTIIVERTPLLRRACREILRVARPGAHIILRHARLPWSDPHALACAMIPGQVIQRRRRLGRQEVQETIIWVEAGRAPSLRAITTDNV